MIINNGKEIIMPMNRRYRNRSLYITIYYIKAIIRMWSTM